MIVNSEIPKIIITSENSSQDNLYKEFNMNILTMVRIDEDNQNATLSLMDQLLWRRHYTSIIVFYEENKEDNDEEEQLINFFHDCWQNGYLSVLLVLHNITYTYTPYPKITVIRLENYMAFEKIQNLRPLNFNGFEISTAFIEYPPRCFSFHSRHGQLIRSGYYYKIVENFVRQYNGSLRPEFVDAWGIKFDDDSIRDLVNNRGFSFIPTHLTASENYESSYFIHFGKCYLIVPAAKEINQNLYLLVSFDMGMWLMMALILIILAAIITVINVLHYHRRLIVESIFKALQIVIFISGQVFQDKTLFTYMLQLLFLCIGLFLTNCYTGNLSSMYTSRIYEADLNTLEDVGRTNLGIHIYSLDYKMYTALENLPAIIYKRFFLGNNTVFNVNRKNLKMVSIYNGLDDTVDLLLYQQLYLKRPLARYIPEPLYTLPMFVTMPHRLAFVKHFDHYICYLADSGILKKFKADSKWDGIMGQTIRFLQDAPPNRAMSLLYLQYAFVMLFFGLLLGFVTFVCEIRKARRERSQISNENGKNN
ncbi:uncharacterized protein LOC101893058 [Musca domestica]|uniref:Uncharacterized protein LOC101893058 n=1 Tax=Musca domestica TaxID=7370 RepID=A0A9J7CJ35_MUSDO|nr:uncharacterized protein LOC101893058 [Musca domestica]